MTTNRYILSGDPLLMIRRDAENFYTEQRIAKRSAQISLTQQHNDLPPYTGPLAVEVLFFMPIPNKGPKIKTYYGAPHISRPYLLPLMTFIDNICRGILWSETSQISSLSMTKKYDQLARTEIIIAEIKHEK